MSIDGGYGHATEAPTGGTFPPLVGKRLVHHLAHLAECRTRESAAATTVTVSRYADGAARLAGRRSAETRAPGPIRKGAPRILATVERASPRSADSRAPARARGERSEPRAPCRSSRNRRAVQGTGRPSPGPVRRPRANNVPGS